MTKMSYDFRNENYPTMKICSLDESQSLVNRPLEKLKLTNGQKVLLHILASDNLVNIDIHFNPEIGSFTCFKGACCKIEKPATTKFLIPVAVYSVDSNMQVINTDLEPYVLHVSAKRIPELLEIAKYNGDLTDMDLVVTSVGDKFPIMKFTYAGKARCADERFAASLDKVQNFIKENEHRIVCTAAKSITAEEYENILAEKDAAAQADSFDSTNQQGPVGLDELFNK